MTKVEKLLSSLKNFELYLNNKIIYDYKIYKGEIADIREAYINNNIQYFVNFWNCKNKNKHFEMQHPLLNHIITRAIFSVQFGAANFILMLDENNQYPWIIGQCQSLVDSIIVDDKLYVISTVMQVDLFKQIHRLSEISTSSLKYKDINFGYLLSQNRPFHHFYDQLRYFYYMDKPKKIFDNKSFFIPNHALKTSEDLVYFFPSGICANQVSSRVSYAKKTFLSDVLDDNLEKNLLLDSLASRQHVDDVHYDLNLWFTICSEKRFWLDQINGYVRIIFELIKYYNSIRIFFDGITAKENERVNYINDDNIYEEICSKLNSEPVKGKKIKPVSLVGLDYKTKIYYGANVDYFISVSGSSLMVPHDICKKKGVIIGNSVTYNLNPSQTSILLNPEEIYDLLIPKATFFKSFHISWEYIYNLLITIINNKEMRKIDCPAIESVVLRWFAQSIASIDKNNSPEDIFLHLIDICEKSNFIDVAYTLLEQNITLLIDKKNKYVKKLEE
ncbi:TPA: hypothetical protein RZK49_001627, partial [Campylobacter coli]|nr:hypothetical protein [Campylobacter coli]